MRNDRDPSAYQQEIYGNPMSATPILTTSLEALEAKAARTLSEDAVSWINGCAGTGRTMSANRAAFDDWAIVPRMLRGVSAVDLTTEIFGKQYSSPILLAPIGVQKLIHPDGELATARAAYGCSVPMILSNSATSTIEEVANANEDGDRWFQLYWPNSQPVTNSILHRAMIADYSALVVTLDTWQLGWRPESLDRAYSPFQHGMGMSIAMSDPIYLAETGIDSRTDISAQFEAWQPVFTGRSRSWSELQSLRDLWPGPILLKGIQHPYDAMRAVELGIDGIIVSNHGGRQIDGAVASLRALPRIIDVVAGTATILFDSGIRTGSDVIKALALGADAVLIGRPYAFGLGMAGEAGVEHAVRCLLSDLKITMGLAGLSRIADINIDLLTPS